MKLKHLFLASLAVCALGSCSDDNGTSGIDIPEENYQMVETSISILASSKGSVLTKATEVGEDQERYINSLTAYLFYADGASEDDYPLAGMKRVTDADYKDHLANSQDVRGVDRIEDIVVKVKAEEAGKLSPTVLKVVLLANCEGPTGIKTLGDLKKATFDGIGAYSFDAVNTTKEKYLPMFSDILTIGNAGKSNGEALIAGTDYDNWFLASSNKIQYTNQPDLRPVAGTHYKYDYTDGKITTEEYEIVTSSGAGTRDDRIPLTRHVARLQLEGLNCNFTNNYAGASFTLKKVYVANATNSSKYLSSTAYGLENIKGYDATTFAYNDDAFAHGCSYVRDDYFLAKVKSGTDGKPVTTPSLVKSYDDGIEISMSNYPSTTEKYYSFEKNKAQFYVFESNGCDITSDAGTGGKIATVNTMLVLEGTWKNGDISRTRYYRIKIKEDETKPDLGVVHNNIYKIYATITGEGSGDPDTSELNACISFSIKVEPWKVIIQTEEDVN